ncbi:MAG TPA: N-acetyl sugar amidotransferase [Ignavibacteria bacterium]|nr:N-acetyl sugar amidotransferase [Ignavibacteria bacterium]
MKIKKMRYCTKCVYPMVSVNLDIDDDGVCSSCRTFELFEELNSDFWDKRKKKFDEIIEKRKKENKDNYDCVIPVSGGKDSYYQTHVMASEYGLKPLLVTYHGNNYLPEGDYNRDNMRHAFDADHLVFGPSVETLKKLNRLCFRKMGDMNWHAHCGIMTYPIQAAVRHNIPLIIWGEIAWDISGMYEPDDYVEFSARSRHEHSLRGFEWYDMINDEKEIISEKDVLWAKYPTDDEILKVGVRGLYVGNFFKWDPNWHAKMVEEKYGFKPSEREFERTYRKSSNLDDRYENGAHDLLKFIKFGYGRASDHASKDVRTGYFSREKAIEMVKKYDSVVSSDLYYWLKYVDMSEDEFWFTADKFRDSRVWWIQDGKWWKDNVWGEPSEYGEVHLPKDMQEKYYL